MTRRRLPPALRRDQLLASTTRLLARKPVGELTLGEVAVEAGVTRAVLYHHFAGRDELCRAALARARSMVEAAVGPPPYDASIVGDLVRFAAAEPAAFRLVFARAPLEPTLADEVREHRAAMTESARRELGVADRWGAWAARLAPDLVVGAVLAWLEQGDPDLDPEELTTRILGLLAALLRAPNATGPGR